MSETKETIEEFRKILQIVNSHLNDEFLDNGGALFRKCLSILAEIGNERIYELTQELYNLLNVRDEIIRADIVATLGYSSRLALPEFQLKSYDIFLNDPSEDVKLSALSSWAAYYIDSKNKDVILILYKIFMDKSYSYIIRNYAYDHILATVDYYGLLIKEKHYSTSPNTEEEFQAQINWNKLNKVLIVYIPEVFAGNLPEIPPEKDERGIFSKTFSWLTRLLCSSKKSSTP